MPSVCAGEKAVILNYASSVDLESYRDQVSRIALQTELDWNRPKIQHVTILRYTRRVHIKDIVVACEKIDLPELTWTIRKIRLIRELIYPSLDVRLLQEYELDKPQ